MFWRKEWEYAFCGFMDFEALADFKEVIETAGYDSKDYFVDDPSGKNVNTHISELEKSGKENYSTDASKLSEGTYVVFMSDNEGVKEFHAAILVVDSTGNAYLQDNSSCNNVIKDEKGAYVLDSNGKKTYEGGTEKTSGGNAATSCSWYTGYEN